MLKSQDFRYIIYVIVYIFVQVGGKLSTYMVCVCVYVRVCVCVYIYMCIYILYMCVYIHIYICILHTTLDSIKSVKQPYHIHRTSYLLFPLVLALEPQLALGGLYLPYSQLCSTLLCKPYSPVLDFCVSGGWAYFLLP